MRQHGENRPVVIVKGELIGHLFHGQLAHVAQICGSKYLAAERSEMELAGGTSSVVW
jgi:hypothetical protein